jgi:hypothetical protein
MSSARPLVSRLEPAVPDGRKGLLTNYIWNGLPPGLCWTGLGSWAWAKPGDPDGDQKQPFEHSLPRLGRIGAKILGKGATAFRPTFRTAQALSAS